MTRSLSSLGEFGLIAELARRFRVRGAQVALGIGDDAALLRPPGPRELLVWTVDDVVEGVHFRWGELPPWRVGWKALAVSVSDVAAMGARPETALLSLGLPRHLPLRLVRAVSRGVERCARSFAVTVVGGNLTRSRTFFASVAVQGRVGRREAVRRSGARPGDALYVTGRLDPPPRHHWAFTPRVAEARFLAVRFRPTSMIDVSDGLLADLAHLCESSHLAARVWLAALPARPAARRQALARGELYELLFTLPPARARALERAWVRRFKTPLARIGQVARGAGITVEEREGSAGTVSVARAGWRHF